MASVIITLKIMPDSPEADLRAIETAAKKLIGVKDGKVAKVEVTPIAFGLKSVNIHFVINEQHGSTEELENSIAAISHVNSVEVTDVRRTVG